MALLTTFGDYQQDLSFLQMRLNTLKSALMQIQKTGEQPGQWSLEQVKTQYRSILTKLDALRREISGGEMPSGFMQALSNFSDDTIAFGQKIGVATGDIVTGVARTVNWLPFLLVGALGVLALGFAKGGLRVRI